MKFSNPLIVRLQTVFWILGWATLATTIFMVGTSIYEHFKPVEQIALFSKREFVFLSEVAKIFSGIGEAFFCFLVSSVFGMIFHRKPIQTQRNESFLILTCLGFIGSGVFGMITWIQSGFDIIPSALNSTLSLEYTVSQIVSYFLFFTPQVLSFLYAVTIYVIFKHFAQLITFESEVV